jgi:hypothetical protein
MTLLLSISAILGYSIAGYTAWTIIDFLLIVGLGIGIYKNSRTCAVLMFIYFVWAKLYMISVTGKFDGPIIALLFGYILFKTILGTFRYNSLLSKSREAESQPIPL